MSMSSLMDDFDLEKWSRSLGFPGVDELEFKENWPKLVCPLIRSEWRHLIASIVPQQKAVKIKKQLLLYKLSTDIGLDGKKMKKFNNVNDYVLYKDLKSQRYKLASLDCKIRAVINEIKEMESILEARDKIIREGAEEEQHIKNRVKTLMLKNQQVNNEVSTLQITQKLVLTVVDKNSYTKEKSPCTEEVKAVLSSLTPGHELEEMSKRLRNAMDKVMSTYNTRSQDKLELLFEMDKECIKRSSYLEHLKNIHSEKESELSAKVGQMLEKMSNNPDEKSRIGIHKFLLEKHIGAVREIGETRALEQFTNSMKNVNEKDAYNYQTEKENISNIVHTVEKKIEEVSFYCSVHIDSMSKMVLNMERSMRREAAKLKVMGDIKEAISVLKLAFGEELKLFFDCQLCKNNVSIVDNVPYSLSDYAIFQALLQKVEEHQMLTQILNQGVKYTFDPDIVSKVKEMVEQNDKIIMQRITETRLQLTGLKCLNRKIADALNFWINQPFADYLPGYPEYTDIKNRYMKVMSEKCQVERF